MDKQRMVHTTLKLYFHLIHLGDGPVLAHTYLDHTFSQAIVKNDN